MDGFEKKRESIKMLMDMLKKSAGDEVNKGMAEHPHVTDLSQTNELQQRTSDSSMMAEGGLVGTDMHESDQASRMTKPNEQNADGSSDSTALSVLPGEAKDGEAIEAGLQDSHNADMVDEDQDNNNSSFMAFLHRKKK